MIETADISGELSCAHARIPAAAGFSGLFPLSAILAGIGSAARGRCQEQRGKVGSGKVGKGQTTKVEV